MYYLVQSYDANEGCFEKNQLERHGRNMFYNKRTVPVTVVLYAKVFSAQAVAFVY
jgi:hypothetical protein